MTSKPVAIITTIAAAAAVVSVSAALAATPPSAKIVITHQTKGCHSWALNGGAFKPNQQLALRRGGYVTIKNNDVMPHTLIQTAGPKTTIKLVNAPMNGMGMHGKISPTTMGHVVLAGLRRELVGAGLREVHSEGRSHVAHRGRPDPAVHAHAVHCGVDELDRRLRACGLDQRVRHHVVVLDGYVAAAP